MGELAKSRQSSESEQRAASTRGGETKIVNQQRRLLELHHVLSFESVKASLTAG